MNAPPRDPDPASESAGSSLRPPVLRATELAHFLMALCIRPGETAIDATVGNGRDTAFLAGLLAPGGRLVGFDIQEAAVTATRDAIGEPDDLSLELHVRGHEDMAEVLGAGASVAGVMFNLGYLPGGDHAVITRTESTLAAVDAALGLLRPGGLVTVVAYPGHPGGEEEAAAVVEWASGLDEETNRAVSYRSLNARKAAPFLVAVERRLR